MYDVSGCFLRVSAVDVYTNARIKCYLNKSVVQVSNDFIFSPDGYERSDGKPKRFYDVPSKGLASDSDRSLFESRRRARAAVCDIALCNKFSHMFTLTLNAQIIDRYNPDEIYKRLRGWLSNVSSRKGFKYVLIPEYHEKKENEVRPAIHFHGLCNPGSLVLTPSLRKNGSQRLTKKGLPIFNMSDWHYGFSTAVPLDMNYERAVNYVTKYITKSESKIFGKWYLSSRFLKKRPDYIILDSVDYYAYRAEHPDLKESYIYRDVVVLNNEILVNLDE